MIKVTHYIKRGTPFLFRALHSEYNVKTLREDFNQKNSLIMNIVQKCHPPPPSFVHFGPNFARNVFKKYRYSANCYGHCLTPSPPYGQCS